MANYYLYTTQQLLAEKEALERQKQANEDKISEYEIENTNIDNAVAVIDTILADVVTATPTGLTATRNVDDIDVSWAAQVGASFQLDRATTSNFADTETVYIGTTNSFTDVAAGLTFGLTYYYRLSATISGYTTSQYATTSIAYLDTLATPTGLNLSTGDTFVTATYDLMNNAMTYDIYRNGVNNFGTATLKGTSVNGTFVDTTTTPGETWYYWIVAKSDFYNDSAPGAFGSIVVV